MKNLCTSSVIQRAWRCSLALIACAALTAWAGGAGGVASEGASADISDTGGRRTRPRPTPRRRRRHRRRRSVRRRRARRGGRRPLRRQGCPCEGAADCASGYCIPSETSAACARRPARRVPRGTLCQAFGEEGDAVELCVPDDYAYCAPARPTRTTGRRVCCARRRRRSAALRRPLPRGLDLHGAAGGREGCVPDAGRWPTASTRTAMDTARPGASVGLADRHRHLRRRARALRQPRQHCDDLVDEDFNFANDPDNCRAAGTCVRRRTDGRLPPISGRPLQRAGATATRGCGRGEEDLTSDAYCGVCRRTPLGRATAAGAAGAARTPARTTARSPARAT